MEIERINENTIKFFISYVDIEDRGFEREEIWYDRERSEKLFWQMMEEVNDKEDFVVKGPLWIQVQALEKGLEVVVTRSKHSADPNDFKLPLEKQDPIELPVEKSIESILESKFGRNDKTISTNVDEEEEDERNLSIVVHFNGFEDFIQLSHYLHRDEVNKGLHDVLYHYDEKYYLHLEFSQNEYEEAEQNNMTSQVMEYANKSTMSTYLLEEYGKVIFANNALYQARTYFAKER